jgi:Flp pilus assembly protein TadD
MGAEAVPTGRPAILAAQERSGPPLRLIAAAAVTALVVVGGGAWFLLTPSAPPDATKPSPVVKPAPIVPTVPKAPPVVAMAPAPAPAEAAPPPVVAAAPPPVPAESAPVAVAAAPPSVESAPPPVIAAAPPVPSRARAPAPVQEDLPSILARIRRDKMAPAIGQPVTVRRNSSLPDLTGAEGESVVSIDVSAPVEREEAEKAYDLLMHARYDEALTLYQKALRESPRNVALMLGAATAEQKLGRSAEARETYRRVLAVDSKNREALTNMLELVAAEAPDRALSELTALRRDNPGFSPIPAEIGAIQARLGNSEAAILALTEAAQASPDNVLYRLNLAILQDRVGNAVDAASSYRTVLDLAGGSDVALPLPVDQIRQRLNYLQGK